MGYEGSKKGRRDQKIPTSGWGLENATDLEQTIAFLKAAGVLHAETIIIGNQTAQHDEILPESVPEPSTYKKDKWEPKLSDSSNEREEQRNTENRFRRRIGMIQGDRTPL